MNIAFFANPLDNHDCKWINSLTNSHNTHIICRPYSRDAKSYVSHTSVQIHEILPALFPYNNPFEVLRLKKRLRRFLRDYEIDVVHSMYAYPNAIFADLSGEVNHIITTRGSDILVDYKKFTNPRGAKEKIIFSIIARRMRKAFNSAKFITSTSIGQQNELKKIVKSPNKSLLVRTGIDTNAIDKIEFQKVLETGVKIFSPRSMKPIYNIELIVDGFADFVTNRDGTHELILIDDFPESEYSQSIKKRIKESQINHCVKLLPPLSFEEMMEEYYNSDIVIMTPKSDGTPNSALEAMYLKKPVVLGDLPYDKDLFNDQTIWQLKENTFTEVNAAFTEILKEHHDQKSVRLENAHNIVKDNAALISALERINQLYHQMVHD